MKHSDEKLVIVSNRLPISVSKKGGQLSFKPSHGGLATALASIKKPTNQVWIGWPGIANEDLTQADRRTITRELKKLHCVPVFLSKEQVEKFYFGYSNCTIWPAFHYFSQHIEYNKSYWNMYQTVNRLYRNVVVRHADDASTIWVHDYHFLLLPQLLRDKLPHSSIGFFLHIPFPSWEIYRLLPERCELLTGLLGADMIGFHTYDYVRYFQGSVLKCLGFKSEHGTIFTGERAIHTDAFPIGIDYDKFASAMKRKDIKEGVKHLKEYDKDLTIIISVDRVDYTKGILERLEAFDYFLKNNPDYMEKVVMVMVAAPSRTNVDAYATLRHDIEQTVGRINGAHRTLEWSPISYQYRTQTHEQIIPLFYEADIAMVTPLRDGMNLIAKEYVATKQNGDGVLILSELAGVAAELPEAVQVNPNNKESVAAAIKQALAMPKKERQKRMRGMQQRIAKYTVGTWTNDFLRQLKAVKAKQHELTEQSLTTKDRTSLIASYKKAKKRLFMLDYDGTLVNFASSPDPAKAKPSLTLKKILKNLAQSSQDEVMIISGRPKHSLDSWFKNMPISLVAEHGGWMKGSNGWSKHKEVSAQWKQALMPILESFTERTPGSRIEQKDFSLVWHYRNVTPDLAYVRKQELKYEARLNLESDDIGIFEGHKIVEFKPQSIHKGTIAKQRLESNDWDFVLCIGDDYNDEDMFRALPESAFTIKVGHEASEARFRLRTVGQVTRLLQDIAKIS